MKIEKGNSLEEVEAVFGQEKSRNGFLLAKKLTKDMRKTVERLYYACYQKHQAPAHVAKEFAIGTVLDKVQQKKVVVRKSIPRQTHEKLIQVGIL